MLSGSDLHKGSQVDCGKLIAANVEFFAEMTQMGPMRLIGLMGLGGINRERLTGNGEQGTGNSEPLLDYLHLNIIPKRLRNLDTAVGLLVRLD
jgi:hypothetical protein